MQKDLNEGQNNINDNHQSRRPVISVSEENIKCVQTIVKNDN